MSTSAETWLVLLALGLYLYDALLLLESDELVLVQRAGGWQPAFGANGWKLARREPLMTNPFSPWQPLARVRWSFEQGLADGIALAAAPALPAVALAPRIGVALLWAIVFVALPLCLFVFRHTVGMLAVIAALYATVVFVLLGLRRDAAALGLPAGKFRMMCIECIACPPFAINVVRRVTLAVPANAELAWIAAQARRAGRLEALKAQLARRVAEQIDAEPEGSARSARLAQAARSLAVHDPS